MTKTGKAIVVLLGIVAALGLAMAGVAISLQMRERDLRVARENELRLVKAEKDELEQQLSEVREAKGRIEREFADVKNDLDDATRQLADERQEKEQLAKTAEDRQQQIDRMLRDLEQTRSDQRTLTDQLGRLRDEHTALQRQLTDLNQAKAQLEQKVVELSKHPTVELDKVVVNPPAASSSTASAPASDSAVGPRTAAANTASSEAASSPPSGLEASPLRGQVIVVNREYDFIVVNLGSNQGLALGQEFQVVRGDQVLGKVKVEKVYEELSAAAILPNSNKDAIREGDAVRPI
ncbi:MAG: hypothetical protein HY596_04545 [Candidatus Omnitrophica bacterium]|nr:hypothetical protein [Candidatus Omnitrophota bacterium]